jgi:hypothetical protein
LVAAADRAGLTRIKGPLGAVMGGLLIGEALYARAYVAPNLQNETAKEAVNQLSTLSAVAAANLIGTRMMQNRTLAKLPPVKGLAQIEAARRVVGTMAAPAPVIQAQRAAGNVRSAAATTRAIRTGVLGAIGPQSVATARRLAVRGGALGVAVAAGAALANTDAGRRAVQWVAGYWRTDPSTGRQAYVAPHQRRIG